MSYESPIEIIRSQMQMQMENEVCNAVMKVGINVDKDELIKALAYDRNQYANGYADGRTARDEEIVRCKDCKRKEKDGISDGFHYCNLNGLQVTDDWFCADGERKDGEQDADRN